MVVNMAVDLPATEKRYEGLVWGHFNSHYIRIMEYICILEYLKKFTK